MSGEGQTSEGHSAIRGVTDDSKDGKTTCGASIQNTEHASPPSPDGSTCSGVPAGPQPPGDAVFSCQYTGRPMVPLLGRSGQTPRTGTCGGERAECAEEGDRIGTTPCKEHETVPGWMRILWARATGLLAAPWGINTG